MYMGRMYTHLLRFHTPNASPPQRLPTPSPPTTPSNKQETEKQTPDIKSKTEEVIDTESETEETSDIESKD